MPWGLVTITVPCGLAAMLGSPPPPDGGRLSLTGGANLCAAPAGGAAQSRIVAAAAAADNGLTRIKDLPACSYLFSVVYQIPVQT
jgi:hypothetical protein